MKRILLLFAILCFFKLSYGQNIYEINLIHETIDLPGRKFYIDSIVDNRIEKSNIGIVQKGLFNTKYPAQLKNGLSKSLLEYFNYSLTKESELIPVTIKVNKFEISEKTRVADEFGFADILLEFYHKNDMLFSSKQHIEVTSMDVTRLHEENIREALKKSLIDFNNSEWLAKYSGKTININTNKPDSIATDIYTSQYSTSKELGQIISNDSNKRNSFTLGYQIGGYSLIGFDYEIRMHDYFGIHFGGGFSGYTYGIMFHTNPKRNSPFFNVSYKDGGFGILKAAGVEYGGKWVFNKKSGFGLLYQIGIVKILKIDEDFAASYFNDGKIPSYMTSMGIGFSW
jgi:hypothetical protein